MKQILVVTVTNAVRQDQTAAIKSDIEAQLPSEDFIVVVVPGSVTVQVMPGTNPNS